MSAGKKGICVGPLTKIVKNIGSCRFEMKLKVTMGKLKVM
jgi:hypothetical protein